MGWLLHNSIKIEYFVCLSIYLLYLHIANGIQKIIGLIRMKLSMSTYGGWMLVSA